MPVFSSERRSSSAATAGRRAGAALRRALRRAYRAAGSGRSPVAGLLRAGIVERLRQRLNAPRTREADVLEVLSALRLAGVSAWLVGGWAADALVGRTLRRHEDIDLVIEADRSGDARDALEQRGFRLIHEVPAGRWLGLQVKMVDPLRRFVALHPVDLGLWEAPSGPSSLRAAARELGLPEPAELFASGTLAGNEVPVLSPATQLVLRCGYEIRKRDREDVAAMCSHFSLPAPRPYAGGGAPPSPR